MSYGWNVTESFFLCLLFFSKECDTQSNKSQHINWNVHKWKCDKHALHRVVFVVGAVAIFVTADIFFLSLFLELIRELAYKQFNGFLITWLTDWYEHWTMCARVQFIIHLYGKMQNLSHSNRFSFNYPNHLSTRKKICNAFGTEWFTCAILALWWINLCVSWNKWPVSK